MLPTPWPDWMDDLWAKSADKGEDKKPEALTMHTWYVLSRLADFIQLRPDLPQRLGAPRLWHILYWAAFLHDFGKAASGFQARLRGGEKWPHRHEVFSLAFVDWIAQDLTNEEQRWLVAAIVSHHRDFSEIRTGYAQPDEDDEEDQLAERIKELDASTVTKLWRWSNECSLLWLDALGVRPLGVQSLSFMSQEEAILTVTKRGAERIYHWLNVYQQFFEELKHSTNAELIASTLTLRGYLINADHSASAHVGALPTFRFQSANILAKIALPFEQLYAHQRTASGCLGSALLTAPTGSGKTEAALLWAAYQAESTGSLPRLFYTLPFQASMNSMKLRLGDSFDAENVGLQHGRGLLALYRMLLEREDDPKEAARQARLIRNLAELNYPPVRVFSPYQMLKGIYRLKGYEALLSDYHGAAFIFDEIHAYEVKRLAMILGTIEYLRKNFAAKFFVMSATFPKLIKAKLDVALDNPTEINAERLLFDSFRRHRLFILEGELLADSAIQRIIDDALTGKSVLVVCNVVDRARQVFNRLAETLSTAGIPVELLHGRFNMRDRSRKEQLVRNATGSKSKQRQPIVLVSTQVVEVSLDIDLDTIYTEPAPLEALIQRFGRINRGRKQRDLAPVYVFDQPEDGQGIYDEAMVQSTLRILRREADRPIDEAAVGSWLDEIYNGNVAERWETQFLEAAKEFNDVCIRPLRPFESDTNLEELFYEAFDGMEVLPYDLEAEYSQLRADDPIRANELLVPISMGQYHALANKGRVLAKEKHQPRIVKAAYNSNEGLLLKET